MGWKRSRSIRGRLRALMKVVIGKAYVLPLIVFAMAWSAAGMLSAAPAWRVGYYAVTEETPRAVSDGKWFHDLLLSLELPRAALSPEDLAWHELLLGDAETRRGNPPPDTAEEATDVFPEAGVSSVEFVELPLSDTLTPLFLEGQQEFLELVMRRAGLNGLLVVRSHGEQLLSRLTVTYTESGIPVTENSMFTTIYDGSFPSYTRTGNRNNVFMPVIGAVAGTELSFLVIQGIPGDGGTISIDGQLTPEIFENTYAVAPGVHELEIDILGFEPYRSTVVLPEDTVLSLEASLIPQHSGPAVFSSLTGDVHWVLNSREQTDSLPVFQPRVEVPLSLAVYKDGFSPFFWQTTQPQTRIAIDLRPAWMTKDIVEIRQQGYYRSMARLLVSLGVSIGVGVVTDIVTTDAGNVPPLWRLANTVATGAVVLTLVDFIGNLLLYGNSVQPEMIF